MRGESVKVGYSATFSYIRRNEMEFLDLNLLKLLLFSMTFFIVVVGSLVNWFEKHLPVFFPQTFRYGKFAYKGKPSPFKVIEVPKSWFKHFYVFSSVYSLYALHLVIDVYLYEAKPSKGLSFYLDLLLGPSRKTNCGSTSVIVALSLITLQSFRRFYETWFVSVFSKGRINATHYAIGFLHYWATITIILGEASGFKEGKQIIDDRLNYFQILGIFIFIYAWINQYNCNRILANLRKNSQGQIVSTQHKIPRGGLFEYVSSPHLTCEVLIYLSLWMILWSNCTFKYVFLWVLSNQVETSLLSHWWYQKSFKNYPKERKAFLPFIF